MMQLRFDRALIEENVRPGSPVLLALSGGADSRAALDVLFAYCRETGRPLAAAHLDHAIRPTSADDARFCASLCAELGIPCYTRRIDVPALAAERGAGLEETAREARYRFFADVMAEQEIPVLVTAHHADDNLETVLMHVARGSGLRGLGGIVPVRPVSGGLLIRPFLRTAKAELEAYCAEHRLAYLTDETNEDTAYTRNRIRAEITPVLKALNPALPARITDMTDALRADEAYLADAADALWRTLPDGRSADAAWLRAQPAAMRWRIFAGMHRTVFAHAGLAATHLHPLDRLLDGEGGRLSLPGRVTAEYRSGKLTFSVDAGQNTVPDADWRESASPGCTYLDACAACAAILSSREFTENVVESDINIYKLFINKGLNFDKIKGRPYWRTREEGDTIFLRGHHRRVKKLMQEAKIPAEDRARFPLLCDDEGIVCLPGVGIRDGLADGTMILVVRLDG